MTLRQPMVLVCSLLVGHLVGSAATGQALSRDELKERFESRYAALVELKTSGKIGETWAGFLGAVEPRFDQDQEIRAIVGQENDDRRMLYRLLADEIEKDSDDPARPDVTPEVVAERNAWRNFQKAAPTELLGVAEGTWVTKQQRPWLLGLLKLQDEGRLGETSDGYVAGVRTEYAGDSKVGRVVELENKARRQLYERLARDEGLSVEAVAARQARRQFKAAHRGVFLRAPDGAWQPKREPSGVLPATGGRG